MTKYADKDRDGRINFEEFLVMITPVKVVDAPIIYAKPKQPNNILANGTADKKDPVSMATEYQDMSEVDKTNITNVKKSQKISPPPPAPVEPITSEKSSTQEIRAENITNSTMIMTATVTTTANTTSDSIPVAILVTTA